jgi:bifunctional non-homologous end joining protein LigD
LKSRSGRVVTSQFPEMAVLPERIALKSAILDGEAVVLDQSGRSDFSLMQQRMNVVQPARSLVESAPVVLYLFDILYADGYDLCNVPLIERKQFLKRLLTAEPPVRYSEHVVGDGEALFKLVREQDIEGIVAKRASSRYCAGRGSNWLKLKTTREVDAVIGGYTAPRAGRGLFGAVLLGLYDGKKLVYIGSAGSGFSDENLPVVWQNLQKLVTDKMPFSTRPVTREKQTWVRPELVARVKFREWTRDRRLRAPVFLGLRTDVAPQECRQESFHHRDTEDTEGAQRTQQ